MSEVFEFTKKVPLEDVDGRPIKEGSVLINIKDGDRGVVTEVGRIGHRTTSPLMAVGDILIKKSWGLYRGTNMYSEWRHIPQDEQTYQERHWSWLNRCYEHDEYASWSEDTGLAIDGILSLLPENAINWERDGGPSSLEDVLQILANHLTELSNIKNEQ